MQQFDTNSNGVLDKLEFEEMMSKLGVFLSRQELRVVFDGFDANKDGNIQWAEFIEGLKVRILAFITLSRNCLCEIKLLSPGFNFPALNLSIRNSITDQLLLLE